MVAYKNGSPIINRCPHQAFDKFAKCGYRISFRIEPAIKPIKELLVKVLHDQNTIATADFTDDGDIFYCQNVHVDPTYRRQGIANAIYVFAEKAIGKRLCNFWNNDRQQTPEAMALWAQPNRPFG
jgi:ribosomal protein S18 acetylase RimI-like enzyme